jgi:hypothetical protein
METKTFSHAEIFETHPCDRCSNNTFVLIKVLKFNRHYNLSEYLCTSCGCINFIERVNLCPPKYIARMQDIPTKF